MDTSKTWSASRSLSGSREHVILWSGADRMSFRELFRLLADDAAFADWYSAELAAAPFSAFFWEHPPLTTDNAGAGAEFVLVDAPVLARMQADPGPFRARFRGDAVVTFRNLGGDALLVAPSPGDTSADFTHLAAYLRTARDNGRRALWRAVARAVGETLSASPTWLSTSGAGVAWLHVRLDRRPKYYQHRPYANPAYEE